MKKDKWFSSFLFKNYAKIIHGFSTKICGDASNGDEARRMISGLNLNSNQLQLMSQQHGDGIAVIKSIETPYPHVDALITNIPNIVLGIRTADCLPILIYDPVKKIIAAVHAGWRGAASHIALKTIQRMEEEFGSKPGDCICVIGPSIGPCCYEVGGEVAGKFPSSIKGGTHLDLQGSQISELLDIGVKREKIEQIDVCTSCEKNLCFSHRRERAVAGRHLALIMMYDS